MENASKALIMAGSILLSLVVISLLVMSFNSLKSLQGTEHSVEKQEQITKFNEQYEVYARNLYGSEILSLANKINNYNKTESENEGYAKIELSVDIKANINNGTNYFKNKENYTSSKFIEDFDNLKKDVETKGKEKISGKLVSQLASMRTADIEALGIKKEDYSEKVTEYNTYKNLLSQIKSKVFTYIDFEYDKNTGRITKMKYSLET